MLNDLVTGLLPLYHSHMVKLIMCDGRTVEGIMAIKEPGSFEIDGKLYSVEESEDILYLGELTDYHTFGNNGEIDSVYQFKREDCINPNEFEEMIYHEFRCRVSCHLIVRDNAIQAVNVKLLQRVHILNKDILAKGKFLYRFADGRFATGVLKTAGENHSVLTEKGEEISFADTDVLDVTRAPMINDFITVQTGEEKRISGIVSAVQEDYLLVIADMMPQMVFFRDVQELRYHGEVTENGIIDSQYQYKPPYYLKDKTCAESIYTGARVSYVAGVNSRYRIAKCIVPEESVGKKAAAGATEHYGVILMVDLSKPDGVGYIGSEYRAKVCGEQQRGNVRFKRGQLSFEYDYNKIYVVRYSLSSFETENHPAILGRMELVQEVDYAQTGIVRVDSEGKVEVYPLYRSVPRYYENRNVDVICRDGVHSGIFIAEEEGIRLQKESTEVSELIPFSEIENVRIKGRVSQYNANGTGYIDNIYFFHINDINNLSTAVQICEGALLSFELRNTRKAAGYYCYNIEMVGELLDGYVTALEEETVRIATAKQYASEGGSTTYFLINAQQIKDRFNNISRYDYPVRYRVQNENEATVISVGEAREKVFFGYIDTYYNDRQFGYITPEQYHGKKTFVERLKENIDVWCRPVTFVNAPEKLDTSLYTYYVKYTLDYSVQDAKAPARSVTFLESFAKNQKTAPAASVREPVLSFRLETVNLAEKSDEESGVNYTYGILAAYAPSFEVFKISEVYQNKKYYSGSFTFSERDTISVDASRALLKSEEKIVTAKYVYVVRFVAEMGEEASVKTGINYEFPIEIISRYSKKLVRKLEVEGTELKLEAVQSTAGLVSQAGESLGEQSEFGTDMVPEPDAGETIFYQLEDGSFHVAEFEYEQDGKLYLSGGQTVEKSEIVVYRLGILTDFDAQLQNGCLNGGVRFSFSVMENKTFNIAKTAKKSLLLVYRTEDNRVSYVEKPLPEMLEQLSWGEGTVTDYAGTDKSRVIKIDGEITHYLSVLTDGLVSRLAKNGELTGRKVYTRRVNCPVWNEQEDTEPIVVAADIHCKEEDATIRYDAVRDRYFAYRDQTHFEPVRGNSQVLNQLVDQQTKVIFIPGETGLQLEAWVENNGNDNGKTEVEQEFEDAEEEQNTTITDSVLGQYCLKQVDLRQMFLPIKTDLDEEGWPVSDKQAIRLIEGFCSGNAVSSANMIAAAAIERRMEKTELNKLFAKIQRPERLLRMAFRRRSYEIIKDGNGNLGEYSYYVTMLLRESQNEKTKREYLYRLFLPDLKSRLEAREELSAFGKNKQNENALERLFAGKCSEENARQVIAHIMALDEQSAEFLFGTGAIEKNEILVQTIMQLGEEIDDTQHFDSPIDCLKMLRAAYQRDRNFYMGPRYLGGDSENGCRQWDDALQKISLRFSKLMGREDMERFQRLADCCHKVATNQTAGYNDRERTLSEAYQEVRDLAEEVKEHPTQQVLEMLVRCNLLEKVQQEIMTELDQLYRNENNLPMICCKANSSEVLRGEWEEDSEERGRSYIHLLVENGTESQPDRQTAQDVVFYFQMLTEDDIFITPKMELPAKELKPGRENRCELVVPVEIGKMEGNGFSIQWSARYTYIDGFDGRKIRRQEPVEVDGEVLNFQFYQAMPKAEKENAENPYEDPAGGNPLDEASEMFYGRQSEGNEIWDYLVTPEEELIPGRAIIVYGQKRCGKSSLINQIKSKMKKSERVKMQAIMLHIPDMGALFGGSEELPYFNRFLYDTILTMFETEIKRAHPEVEQLLAEHQLVIPKLRERYSGSGEYKYDMPSQEFTNFFEKFELYDKKQHKIILIMDEFTGLCTSIMRNLSVRPDYQNYPKFIKMLSGMGFIQIVVGHAAMMRALGELGVINSTAEFAKKIEISALQEEDCRKLVREPMETCFGFDVYGTELGKDAVEKLLELSGCSPSILMKLCDRMFRYFVEKKEENYIDMDDVDLMLKSYLRILKTTDFDMLLTEDGDEPIPDYKKPSYIYLRHVSRESWKNNNHDCDSETVCTELVSEQGLSTEELQTAARIKSAEMRETLFDRKVISVSSGRIRIIMWLFAEFLKFKDGENL